MDEIDTCYFAPEIEQSVVSLLWHEPERLAGFYRDFDLGLHIGQIHLHIILDAINQAYGELGTTDFATVAQIVRELGKLTTIGGLDGLNQVYTAQLYGREDRSRTDKIWTEYLRLLRYYAQNRKQDPPRQTDFFTKGWLKLYPNKTKYSELSPDATGTGKIAGRTYLATARLELDPLGEEFFNISLILK
jgi:hypothetical protein